MAIFIESGGRVKKWRARVKIKGRYFDKYFSTQAEAEEWEDDRGVKRRLSGEEKDELIKNLNAKKTIKQDDVINLLLNNVVGKVQALPSITPVKLNIKIGKGTPETMVALLSDLQGGHKTKSTTLEVLRDRLKRYVNKLVKVSIVQMSDHPIKGLCLFILGDLVQNELLGKYVSGNELETTVFNQMMFALEEVSQVIIDLMGFFGNVNVYCVTGNHGRISEMTEDANWDQIIYLLLKERLQNQKNIKFYIANPGEFFIYTKIEETKFILIHGDGVRSMYGTAYYGMTRRALNLNDALEQFDCMCSGHWHNVGKIPVNRGEILVNGTFVTDDMYALKKYGVSNDPCQLAFSVHPEEGITAEYKLKLITKDERSKVDVINNIFEEKQ